MFGRVLRKRNILVRFREGKFFSFSDEKRWLKWVDKWYRFYFFIIILLIIYAIIYSNRYFEDKFVYVMNFYKISY